MRADPARERLLVVVELRRPGRDVDGSDHDGVGAGLRVADHDVLGSRSHGGGLGDQAVPAEHVDVQVGVGLPRGDRHLEAGRVTSHVDLSLGHLPLGDLRPEVAGPSDLALDRGDGRPAPGVGGRERAVDRAVHRRGLDRHGARRDLHALEPGGQPVGVVQRGRRTARLDLELPDAGSRLVVRTGGRGAGGGVRVVGEAAAARLLVDRHAVRVDGEEPDLVVGVDAGERELEVLDAFGHRDEDRLGATALDRAAHLRHAQGPGRDRGGHDGDRDQPVDTVGCRVVDPQDGRVRTRRVGTGRDPDGAGDSPAQRHLRGSREGVVAVADPREPVLTSPAPAVPRSHLDGVGPGRARPLATGGRQAAVVDAGAAVGGAELAREG